MKPKSIPTLFCPDGSYFQHAGAAMASLLQANRAHTFDIFVCSETRNPEAEEKLSAIASRFGNASIKFLDFNLADRYGYLKIDRYFTLAAYMRLFVTEFLDPKIDRLLYLDCDIIVRRDIGELWQTDMDGAFVAAVPDPCIHSHLGFKRGDLYFNSGVMLVDVARWRKANILPELLQFAMANAASIRHYDQDVLNCVLRGKIKPLDYRWNFHSFFPDLPPETLNMSMQDFDRLRRAPSIVHFTTEYKPWFYKHEPHYKKIYYDALALTPWKDYRPPDQTPRSVVLKALQLKRLKERLRWYIPRPAMFFHTMLGAGNRSK